MSALHDWAMRHRVPAAAYQELCDLLNPSLHITKNESGKSEGAVQQNLRVLAPKNGNSLWRNNTGAFQDDTGRWVRYGLGNDSKKLNEVWKPSDLIGITQVRAGYPGQLFGVFTAVEVKEEGWYQTPGDKRAAGQANFMNTVRSMGGLAGFAQSETDYLRIIGHA